MNSRLVAATAIVGAVVIGAVGYAIGVSNRTAELTADQRAVIEAAVAAAVPTQPDTDALRVEIEAIVAATLPAPTEADASSSEIASLSPGQTGEVEALIRSHLIANPEIITDAIAELQAREAQAELTAQVDAITENADIIFASDRQFVIGNPDGDVTLVEFFDYNCSFCRRAMDDVQALVDKDPNLRVVLKEFPVLGEGSVEAARVSVAVGMTAPERFEEFHFTLLSEQGQVDGARALAVAEDMGIDAEKISALIESDIVRDTINEVYEIAGFLNLSGTPTFVTANQVVVGAVGEDALRAIIYEIRAN